MTTSAPGPVVPPPPIPPPPSISKEPRIWIGLLVGLFVAWMVVSVVLVFLNWPTGSSSRPVPKHRALSAHDISTLSKIDAQLAAFNRAALPVYAGYTDPDVISSEWIRTADRHLDDMRAAQASMLATALTLEDAEVQRVVIQLTRSIGRQLNAVIDIRNAVEDRDVNAERSARDRLTAANAERAELSQELAALLRSLGGPSLLP